MKRTHATNVAPSQNPSVGPAPLRHLGQWPEHEDHRVAPGG